MYCTLIGVHFIMAPMSFLWNYGNLSAYMDSYFRLYCYPDCVDGDSQWIVNLYTASACPGVFLAWFVLKKTGPKMSGILIMIVCNAAFIASAWMLQASIIGTAILMGLIYGMGIGPTMCIAFMYVEAWADKRTALFIATVTSAPTILAIAQNQIITAYVNPQNLEADVYIGNRAYFSNPGILASVPEIIIIVGAMNFGLQVIGYFLISSPSWSNSSADSQATTRDDLQKSNGKSLGVYLATGANGSRYTISDEGLNTKSTLVKCTDQKHYDSNTNNFKGESENGGVKHNHCNGVNKSEKVLTVDKIPSLKPLEAMKTSSFYALWLYGASLVYGLILKNNYYKQFGLLYINDDQFLTLIGSLVPVFASATRVVMGSCIDRKILNIQDCIVIGLATNSLLCAFWFFAPQVNEILYLVLILGLACAHSMAFTLIATGVIKLYGTEHFYLIYGLNFSSSTFVSMVTAVSVTAIRDALGWYWLFASCSVMSVLVLGYSVLANFHQRNCK